jgi:23S rRNA (guanosine2251-2'-O)-methyltransferase
MYNDLMPESEFEVRVCASCGLRYPLVSGHPFGTRCPSCLGETRLILRRPLVTEPARSLPDNSLSAGPRIAVLLDNVRSAWNTGSILRSADGFGFSQVYLCGITPTPDQEAVTRTSLGAEDAIPWSYHRDAVRLVKGLKKEGLEIVALEEARKALDIRQVRGVTYDTVMIVGNEVTGVDPEILAMCDRILSIPMRGEKKSFNVAIAFGIAAYALSGQ